MRLPLTTWLRLLVTSACLIGSCHGTFEFTTSAWNLQVGQPFTMTWTGASGPVIINLVQGTCCSWTALQVIDWNDTSTSFTWTPPDNDGGRTWAFQIVDSTDAAAYSPQFTIANAASGTSQTTGTATSTAASTATSTALSTGTSTPVSGTTTTTGTGLSSSTDASAATSLSSTTSTDAAQSTDSSDPGLSVGAKAGIGIGAGLGGLLLLAAMGLLSFRLGRASAKDKATGTTKQNHSGMAELGNTPKEKPELAAGVVVVGATEMHTHANTPELAGGPGGARYPAELS